MALTNDELTELLDRLLASPENEVVEFKAAARQFSADKTGEYVSALSNESNLRGIVSGWLIFGVSNARQVVGTTHLVDVQQRQTLKHHIHQSIDQELTIREVHEVTHTKPRWELSYAGHEGTQSEPSRKKDDDVSGTARGPGPA